MTYFQNQVEKAKEEKSLWNGRQNDKSFFFRNDFNDARDKSSDDNRSWEESIQKSRENIDVNQIRD